MFGIVSHQPGQGRDEGRSECVEDASECEILIGVIGMRYSP